MPKIFSEAAVNYFNDRFIKVARPGGRGGCMQAVYAGLGALYGDNYAFKGRFFKSFFRTSREKEIRNGQREGVYNTVDRVFRALEDEGITATEQRFTPISDAEGGGWTLQDGTTTTSIESSIESQLSGFPDGSHFFGIAIRGGQHSLTIQVVKSGPTIQIFWMDQYSNGTGSCRAGGGFVGTPDVTGRLDTELREFGLSKATSMWMFKPEMAEHVMVPVDTNGDGVMDSSTSAVTDTDAPTEAEATTSAPPTEVEEEAGTAGERGTGPTLEFTEEEGMIIPSHDELSSDGESVDLAASGDQVEGVDEHDDQFEGTTDQIDTEHPADPDELDLNDGEDGQEGEQDSQIQPDGDELGAVGETAQDSNETDTNADHDGAAEMPVAQ